MRYPTRGIGVLGILLFVSFVAGVACDQAANEQSAAAQPDVVGSAKPVNVQRYGMVIGLKKDMADRYNELHANPWPEINAMLKKCNIRDYSIYEVEIDGKLYLFSYFEYVGGDFEKDMATMAADPKTKQWWAETDPCQIRIKGTPKGQQWLNMKEVYHLD